MTPTDAIGVDAADAARRFVRVDSGGGPDADDELASWLAAGPANERAMERVELAAALGRRLAADPASPLWEQARRAVRPRALRRPAGRALLWGSSLAAALLAAYVLRGPAAKTPEPEPLAMEAARRVAVEAPTTAATVLPSGAVIDASTVAVLPFAGFGDASLAVGLERDVAEALRTVPGLYVVADAAVQPYAGTDLDAAEIGGQLGARGLVDAAVELVDGRVLVSARLRESATGATLWQTQVDRPIDELREVRIAIAEQIAAAMFDSTARLEAARIVDFNAPSSAKPFQQ
jgi:TolB-like protein